MNHKETGDQNILCHCGIVINLKFFMSWNFFVPSLLSYIHSLNFYDIFPSHLFHYKSYKVTEMKCMDVFSIPSNSSWRFHWGFWQEIIETIMSSMTNISKTNYNVPWRGTIFSHIYCNCLVENKTQSLNEIWKRGLQL